MSGSAGRKGVSGRGDSAAKAGSGSGSAVRALDEPILPVAQEPLDEPVIPVAHDKPEKTVEEMPAESKPVPEEPEDDGEPAENKQFCYTNVYERIITGLRLFYFSNFMVRVRIDFKACFCQLRHDGDFKFMLIQAQKRLHIAEIRYDTPFRKGNLFINNPILYQQIQSSGLYRRNIPRDALFPIPSTMTG